MINRQLERDAYAWADRFPELSKWVWEIVSTPPGDEASNLHTAIELHVYDKGWYIGYRMAGRGDRLTDVLKSAKLSRAFVDKVVRVGLNRADIRELFKFGIEEGYRSG